MKQSTKEHVLRWIPFFACTTIFLIVSVPFRMLSSFLGITEIRPASALPPVFGLLFGHYGALAAAVGNLIADISSGYPLPVLIAGFFMQFLYAYIPYKLWHSILRDANNGVHLQNVRNVAKFMLIVFIDACMMAVFLNFVFKQLGNIAESGLVSAFVFFNNVIYSMLLGIPLIIAASNLRIPFFMPEKHNPRVGLAIIPLVFACIIGLVYAILTDIHLIPAVPPVTNALFYLCLALGFSCVFAFPLNARTVYSTKENTLLSLTEQTTIAFMLIGILAVIIIGVVSYYSNYDRFVLFALWDEIYFSAGIGMSVLFVLIFTVLSFIERVVTKPISTLSTIIVAFAESKHSPEENKKLIAQCEKVDCRNSETSALSNSLVHTIIEVQNYVENLQRVTAEKKFIEVELHIAAKIQLGVLPQTESVLKPDSPFALFPLMQPAKEVGGDFYDFFFIDSNHLVLLVADVAGKGIPASLFMMRAKTVIKETMLFGLTPAKAFNHVNKRLCTNNEAGMFVTAFMCVINTETGECVYVNAGHNPPVFKKSGGCFEFFLAEPSLMLAGLEDTMYTEKKFLLTSGDTFFLYTDGVTEAMDTNGNQFGDTLLLKTLNANADANPQELAACIKTAIETFANGESQSDDITILAFKFKHV